MDSIKALILDMDGVLWRGSQPIGDLPTIFAEIRRKGLGVALATNNATHSVADYLAKLAGFGVQLGAQQIVTSGLATAHFLKDRFPHGGAVFVIGEAALKAAIKQAGFTLLDAGDNPAHTTPDAVVVGKDESFTYHSLNQAMQFIRAGALFVATNPDKTFPMPAGRQLPGAGAMVAAVEAAAGIAPMVIGKPAAHLYRAALDILGVPARSTLVVGDRIETDIVGGQALGCPTALVLSGVTTAVQAHEHTPPPHCIAQDLAQVVSEL